ncbi:hypothetical protein BIZ83_gp021 [Erwinia phage vB_EamM_ChrisDB]|uniref:hypothetical protein n=1 Tax=Erwinia phage vB_EamM_ChrisDB TaxID=1883371 RepID=UPI00081C7960|nr:hypothetical protein BIZ83_gp021 [Erwinia phage vB_EamM_ChrisDB]ANZ48832.1 hypothetical protein CHRISDB_270 [Erwinia phage vB_EamM_ChrisDB]
MKAVNIVIPPTLTVLAPDEIKAIAFNAIQGRVGKDVLAVVLSGRLDTKRKINNAIASLSTQDLTEFYLALQQAGVGIDYTRTYFLLTESYRSILTVKQ